MEKISIIVPVYNVELYLEKCIESIINQTYTNIEIILVDDGATDSSGNICDLYSKKDSRIKVIHKRNGGLSDARNVGIEKAVGQYLMFVDSDDYIDKTMCEKLYNALKKQKTDMAMCDIVSVDINGNKVQHMNGKSPIIGNELNIDEIFNKFSDRDYWYFVVAWNKLYHKKLFEKVRYPFGKIHEDEFVFHHLLDICKTVAIVPECLYHYVQRENSIVNSKKTIKSLDGAEAFFDRVRFALNNGRDKLAIISYKIGANRMISCYNISKESEINRKRFLQVYDIYKKYYKKICKLKLTAKNRVFFFLAYHNISSLCFLKNIKTFFH